MVNNKLIKFCTILLGIIVFGLLFPLKNADSQVDQIIWDPPINISNSPDNTSTDSFLLADPSGFMHLFWAEKMGEAPGNQADTIMYSVWDGKAWSKPVDIFFSPLSDGTPIVAYPHAVLDTEGQIHLMWLTQPNFPNYALNYSIVPANRAAVSSAWKTPVRLIEDMSGTKYSFHLAFREPNELHVVAARGHTGDTLSHSRTVSYFQSLDGGLNWSPPTDIFVIDDRNRGASDTKILLDSPNVVYSSWTEWDESGNGQVVYFSRSQNNGKNWDPPIMLAVRIGDEYERDWNNMALLGQGRIISVWEGGWRAYRQAMFSNDGGLTWSLPIDLFPYLIGDNGAVEFAYDGSHRLHMFLAQRIREGNLDREDVMGLWHSVYDGGMRWREAILAAQVEAITNPKVAIVNGNRIVTTWYSSGIYEIYVMTGRIDGAAEISPVPRKKFPDDSAIVRPTDSAMQALQAIGTPAANQTEILEQNQGPVMVIDDSEPSNEILSVILFGIVPVILIVFSVIVVRIIRPRNY